MNTRKILENKNIIVTGSARGIGKQMVKTFAENGANVYAHARKVTDDHLAFCQQLSKDFSVQIIPVYFDMREEDQIKDAVKVIRSSKLPVDGFVNNAGIIHNALFQMTSMEELRNQFEVNFFGPFLFTQYISKLMVRNKKGSIVNISSSAALDGNSGRSAYGASKAALLCMTKCISEEFGVLGIRANIICPGMTDTDMLDTVSEHILNSQIEASFLKKIGKPLDIANAAMFLLSDYSSYITGQVFRIDGGITGYDKRP